MGNLLCVATLSLLTTSFACNSKPPSQNNQSSKSAPAKSKASPDRMEATVANSPDANHAPPGEDTMQNPPLELQAIIRHLKPERKTATGRLFSNIDVQRSDERWALVGCEASVAGSCRRTKHVFLAPEQITQLHGLLRSLLEMPDTNVGDGCYRVLAAAEELKPGEFTISYQKVSYLGSMQHARAGCPPLEIARYLERIFNKR